MVRVTWPDHIVEGSRAYVRADKTSLQDAVSAQPPEFVLTGDSVRKLRDLVESLQARRGPSRRAKGSK